MDNLQGAINKVKAIPGFVTYRKRAEDHNGMVQCYTFWFDKNSILKDYEVRFLVQQAGTTNEEARCYGTQHIVQDTSFRDSVAVALTSYIAAHNEYMGGSITSCNERDKIALVSAFKVDDGDMVAPVQALVCGQTGSLEFKLFKGG